MLDLKLRSVKDSLFDPLCLLVPRSVTPLQITIAAFVLGSASCVAAAYGLVTESVTLWVLNRALDCLDGAVARKRNQASDLGGFLDLLGDFIVYSAIPISCALSVPVGSMAALRRLWLAVAVVQATFHINNFVLFFVAALAEKDTSKDGKKEELTSVMMKPALIEGFESGIVFTLMLASVGRPSSIEVLCWILSTGVLIGTLQRVVWAIGVLK